MTKAKMASLIDFLLLAHGEGSYEKSANHYFHVIYEQPLFKSGHFAEQ